MKVFVCHVEVQIRSFLGSSVPVIFFFFRLHFVSFRCIYLFLAGGGGVVGMTPVGFSAGRANRRGEGAHYGRTAGMVRVVESHPRL